MCPGASSVAIPYLFKLKQTNSSQVGQTAMVPLEFCTVPRGQFMRKEIPDDKVRDILEFSTKKPSVRLASIKDGLQVRCLINI